MTRDLDDVQSETARLRSQLAECEAANRELRQIEDQLTRFRTLFDLAFDLLCIADFDGYFKHLNPAWERTIGFSADELKAQPFIEFVHPDDRETTLKAAEDLSAGERIANFENRYLCKDGSVRWLHWNAVPDPDEALIYAAVQDVTTRKRVDDEIQRDSRELERSNRDLEQFAYIASHDLQEPLRMVSSYLQLLQRRYQGQLDDDADEFIGYAVHGANRMKALINALFSYSRVSRSQLKIEPVDAVAVLRDVLTDLQLAVEDAGAEITHDPLPTVSADRSQFRQVLQNLIENGLKFRSEGTAPHIHVGVSKTRDVLTFHVRDNGIGIDTAYLDQLFIPFKRLHGHDAYSGTGIGLAMCKRIVERHGGEIWVTSELAQGTTVHFTLREGRV